MHLDISAGLILDDRATSSGNSPRDAAPVPQVLISNINDGVNLLCGDVFLGNYDTELICNGPQGYVSSDFVQLH